MASNYSRAYWLSVRIRGGFQFSHRIDETSDHWKMDIDSINGEDFDKIQFEIRNTTDNHREDHFYFLWQEFPDHSWPRVQYDHRKFSD